jgi:hypothetical protein
MAHMQARTLGSPGGDGPIAERLERGEVVHFPKAPFTLPEKEDLAFLLEQRLASRAHKNISYDPLADKTAGFLKHSAAQAERMRGLLAEFSRSVTGWLSGVLPAYARSWQLDRVSFRPDEEATRQLRLKARNDLLHVDAFPSRPTNGYRILRVFANVNPTEPRVWVTSDPFRRLLDTYGSRCGLPTAVGPGFLQQVVGMFSAGRRQRSTYDAFMLKFHNYLKANDNFQERGTKRYWHFQPGSAWLCMTDTTSHAVLRGRFALEHSYFIAPEAQVLPAESPAALLEKACGHAVLNKAA